MHTPNAHAPGTIWCDTMDSWCYNVNSACVHLSHTDICVSRAEVQPHAPCQVHELMMMWCARLAAYMLWYIRDHEQSLNEVQIINLHLQPHRQGRHFVTTSAQTNTVVSGWQPCSPSPSSCITCVTGGLVRQIFARACACPPCCAAPTCQTCHTCCACHHACRHACHRAGRLACHCVCPSASPPHDEAYPCAQSGARCWVRRLCFCGC